MRVPAQQAQGAGMRAGAHPVALDEVHLVQQAGFFFVFVDQALGGDKDLSAIKNGEEILGRFWMSVDI